LFLPDKSDGKGYSPLASSCSIFCHWFQPSDLKQKAPPVFETDGAKNQFPLTSF